MKLYKRWRTDMFPWLKDNPWELVCHCLDKEAANDYIKSNPVMNSGYEFMVVEGTSKQTEAT